MLLMFVVFDPKKIPQEVVDKLEAALQTIGANALSSPESRPPAHPDFYVPLAPMPPEDIFVGQYCVHETDVNPAPLAILVLAGRADARDPDRVERLISGAVFAAKLVPREILGEGQSCTWVHFSERNGFGFIGVPRRVGRAI